jgi:hypothetical protein
MRIFLLSAIFPCIIYSSSFAQTQGELTEDVAGTSVVVNPTPPATNLQRMEVEKGRVIIKGYSDVARITGERNSAVRVIAIRMTDDNNAKESGVVLVVASARGADVTATSYIDYDELDSLINALDALQKADKNSAPLADFEARYRTRGDLELANLNIDGSRMIAVKSNQILIPSGQYKAATAYFRAARLSEIRQQIIAAKGTLDNVK